jgi:hypothetical protein
MTEILSGPEALALNIKLALRAFKPPLKPQNEPEARKPAPAPEAAAGSPS